MHLSRKNSEDLPTNLILPSHGSDVTVVSTEEQINNVLSFWLHNPTPGIYLSLSVFEIVIIVEIKLRNQSLKENK